MKRIGNKKGEPTSAVLVTSHSPVCRRCLSCSTALLSSSRSDTSYQPLLSMKTAPAQLTERRQRLAPDKPTPLLACPALPRLASAEM